MGHNGVSPGYERDKRLFNFEHHFIIIALRKKRKKKKEKKKELLCLCWEEKEKRKKKVALDALFLIVSIFQEGHILLLSCEKSWRCVRCGRWRSARVWQLRVCTGELWAVAGGEKHWARLGDVE